jgi:hypothetical protein
LFRKLRPLGQVSGKTIPPQPSGRGSLTNEEHYSFSGFFVLCHHNYEFPNKTTGSGTKIFGSSVASVH